MAAPVAELRTELSASVSRFQQDFKKAQGVVRKSTKGMGNSFRGLSKSSTGLASSIFSLKGGFALLAGAVITQAIKKFTDLDKGLREIGTLMGGLTDKQMKAMGDELKLISIQSGQALDKLVKARYDIVSAGFADAADSAELLRVSADLAVAGVSDVSTTADLLTTAVNAYGLEAKDATDISDKMFTIVKLGKTTIDQMAGSMGKVLAVAAPMGVSLDEVGASLAVLTANGQSTEEALTAIRAAIVEFAKPGKELADALKSIGVESGEALLKEEGFQGALEAVSKAAIANDTTIVQLLGNIRSMQAVLPLATTGAENFAVALDDIGKASGSTNDALAEMEKSASLQFDRFGKAIDVITVALGGNFTTALASLAGDFADMVENVQIITNRTNELGSATLTTAEAIGFFQTQLLTGQITLEQYKTAVAGLKTAEDNAAAAAEGAARSNEILKLSFGEVVDAGEEVVDITDEELDAFNDLLDAEVRLTSQELKLANAASVLEANQEAVERQTRAVENATNAAFNAMFTYAGFLKGGAADSFRKFIQLAQTLRATLVAVRALQVATSAGGKVNFLASLFGFANGGVFSNGSLTAFGGGGIVNGPTLFPMADGMGLMGEAGKEAIMPLTRIGGKLGVESTGGGDTFITNEFTFVGPTDREYIQKTVIPMIEESSRAQSTSITTLRDFERGDSGLEIKRAPQ